MSFGEGDLHDKVAGLESLTSDMWRELCHATGAKAVKCRACGRTVVAFSRGMPRMYCDDTCRKWANRNPGKKRAMREKPKPGNFMEALLARMEELGIDGGGE